MSGTDRVVTMAAFMTLEAPSGTVRICDGGFLKFDDGSGLETFESEHSVFGSIAEMDAFEAAFGDVAESASIAFHPHPDAVLTDWYTPALRDSAVKFWLGEVDRETGVASNAELLADMLVDVPAREISAEGELTLAMELSGRAERLFLTNQGNVCSERFHKSVWAGEDGFNNCTDTPVPVAWGAAAPPTGTSTRGGGFTDPNSPTPSLL